MTDRAALWSVGHGARPVEELVADLRRVGIGLVVDVRTAPGSRRHPQFGKDALSATLGEAGIGYEWRKDLGGWRRTRPDSPHVALRSPSFRGYADYMETAEFERALAALVETASRTPTAFMCAEAVWWRCHRRMIADALLVRGHDVRHILPGGRTEPHRLHPAARPDCARLVYDRAEPAQLEL